ncbi:MAG: hypothetical protein OXF79_22715 [Chloroflexi bacterium]|nr:hypothetical protein [Chloroflexota bacterium]
MQGFDFGNDIIILFYAVMAGNLLAPVCLPVITGMMCGGFMANVNPDHGLGQGFKAMVVSLGVAALWTVLLLMATDGLARLNFNVFFGGLAVANLCGVVAAFFLCRNLNDYREFERSINQRRR